MKKKGSNNFVLFSFCSVEPVANAAQSFDAKSWLDDADDWGDDANDWGDDAISDDPGRCRHKENAKKAKKKQ